MSNTELLSDTMQGIKRLHRYYSDGLNSVPQSLTDHEKALVIIARNGMFDLFKVQFRDELTAMGLDTTESK